MKGNEQIVVDFKLAEPPAEVWRALTEPELLSRWLMDNDIAPIVGHQFKFHSEPMGDWDGIVYCEVLEVVPQQRLVYSWKSMPNTKGEYKLETTVTWTLKPGDGDGTLLKLVHHGFMPDDYGFKVMAKGWKKSGVGISRALAS
jgi:uncharacterized protein YndB with AHSA1/START domain